MKTTLLLLFFSLSLSLNSQNLVLNPSFEDLRKKENEGFVHHEDFNDNLLHWTSPTRASPDYHNKSPEVIPENYTPQGDPMATGEGVSPRNGNKMTGIYTSGYIGSYYCDKITGSEIKEYIQGTLSEALVPGQPYFVRFWVTKSNSNAIASNLGVSFHTEQVQKDDCYLLDFEAPIFNGDLPDIEDSEWVAISGTFTASKAFRHFIIGHFDSKKEDQKTTRNQAKNYFYIDDVYIAKVLTKAEIAVLKAQKKKKSLSLKDRIEKEKVIVLDRVFFETDSWVLKALSSPQLEELAQWLKSQPDTKILIKGHTDNRGKESYNQQLSERRAQSVASDLQKRGVSTEQLKAVGYGSQQALNNNQTEEERQKNRRVEFEVVEKF